MHRGRARGLFGFVQDIEGLRLWGDAVSDAVTMTYMGTTAKQTHSIIGNFTSCRRRPGAASDVCDASAHASGVGIYGPHGAP
jgi:hypothetical protein